MTKGKELRSGACSCPLRGAWAEEKDHRREVTQDDRAEKGTLTTAREPRLIDS